MKHELTHPHASRYFGHAAHDIEPLWSWTDLKHDRYLKSAVEIVFIAAIVAWAFVVPFFKDSMIQAVQNLFSVP